MTKDEALRKVAVHMAGILQAGDLEEATGISTEISAADEKRLVWAIGEVSRRLYKMGAPR